MHQGAFLTAALARSGRGTPDRNGPHEVVRSGQMDAPTLVEQYSALCGEVFTGRAGGASGAGTIVNNLMKDARNQVSFVCV
jgi:hypothetical protein